eukprot:TRINITY_DN2943_c0_g1_i1.p1 TRINITY_DN2943_c0_g1~~TRINITY_DN2943_c0_g1_i1.p1  ORF type:complete len:385 (+),score=55.38 TRINITY_DN2943_c0_g1_i1:2091-3245(+)
MPLKCLLIVLGLLLVVQCAQLELTQQKRFVIDQIKSDHRVLKEALERRGWTDIAEQRSTAMTRRPTATRLPFEFKWTWSWDRARVSYEHQIINHFPNFGEITTKDGLHRNLNILRRNGTETRHFYPRSYLACDVAEFSDDFDLLSTAADHGTPTDPIQMASENFISTRGQRIDGTRNMWVVKPARAARGVGIEVYDSKQAILAHTQANNASVCGDFIVQKYIERPMLIDGKKFDIRQFVLVTSLQPLRAYVYSDFYLRFCTVPYSDQDVSNRFVHLTNHQIQKESDTYQTSGIPGNQWSRDEFVNYLNIHNGTEAWSRLQAAIRTMLGVSLQAWPSSGHRNNSFELLGYDIMIDDALQPWLIEINANPGVRKTTTPSFCCVATW